MNAGNRVQLAGYQSIGALFGEEQEKENEQMTLFIGSLRSYSAREGDACTSPLGEFGLRLMFSAPRCPNILETWQLF
jgi:hypothetical protein